MKVREISIMGIDKLITNNSYTVVHKFGTTVELFVDELIVDRSLTTDNNGTRLNKFEEPRIVSMIVIMTDHQTTFQLQQ